MNNNKKEPGMDSIARTLARNFNLNSRSAKAEARRIRDLFHDAVKGEPVEVPGLDPQVWGQQPRNKLDQPGR
jgi:hypothetical protein